MRMPLSARMFTFDWELVGSVLRHRRITHLLPPRTARWRIGP